MNNKGLTTLEIIFAVAIFSTFMVSVTDLLINTFYTKNIIFDQLSTQNEGRKFVQDFVNEIRGATYSSVGAYPIESASSTQIVFFTNLDEDNFKERVRYFLSTSTLMKGVTKPAGNPLVYSTSTETITKVLHYVANGTSTQVFSFFDANYTGLQNPMSPPLNLSRIRLIEMKVILDKNPAASPNSFIIQAKANVRNLKDN